MRKIVYIAVLFLVNLFLSSAQKAEQIKSIAHVYKSHDWYLKQAELWKSEIDKNPMNENGWYNYFMANRMARFEFDNKGDSSKEYYSETPFLMNPDSLVGKAQLAIPNTFTSNYLVWRNLGCSPSHFQHLEKAYALNPTFEGINSEMVVYYETQYEREKRKYYNEAWYKSKDQSHLNFYLLSYNYNVLMSVKENGLLLTFGDNDTFPIWILQDVFGIRQDVISVNVNLLSIDAYRDAIFKELNIRPLSSLEKAGSDEGREVKIVDYIITNKPANLPLFIGLTSWKEFDKYPNMYLEGLVLEYSIENIDNIAYLKNNFENKYQLDYITNRFVYEESPEIVNRMNMGYLAGIFKLYDHYKKSGDFNNAEKMKALGLSIGNTLPKETKDWIIESLK